MVDCIDNPMFAAQRSDILPLQTMCANAGHASGAAGAGDGLCNERSTLDFCDDATLGAIDLIFDRFVTVLRLFCA